MLTIPPSPPPLPQSVFGELNGADRQKWGKGEEEEETRTGAFPPFFLPPNACGPDFAVAAVSRGGRGRVKSVQHWTWNFLHFGAAHVTNPVLHK